MAGQEVRVPIASVGLWRTGGVGAILGLRVRLALSPWGHGVGVDWIGWGAKPSALRASRYARLSGGRVLRLEDGFLRSFGTGSHHPPLSLVVDEVGIYYDSNCPSALENLLNSGVDLPGDLAAEAAQAKGLLLTHRLSKYNHAPDWEGSAPGPKVLVVDQTAGDMSVALGGASERTFAVMLAAARAENPHATVYVKSHPEVAAGRKRGYLTDVQDDESTVVLRQAVNPLSLIERMDRVYVVTSTMGFEALLAGKPVSVFGKPWYAGWGVTDDRQVFARRTRKRSVDGLFAAAYLYYTRYLNPVTHQSGTIFDVIDWLVQQRQAAKRFEPAGPNPRLICVGFRRWKAANMAPMLSLDASQVMFVPSAKAAEDLLPNACDQMIYWGSTPPTGLLALCLDCGAQPVRMEDGFVRSVGLGSDLIRPLSLVLDTTGIYFDPRQPSDLEKLLNAAEFTADELTRAERARAFIVEHGITKYNLEPRSVAAWPTNGKPVVLVPGQVEDDASIRLGCAEVNTNVALLRAARLARPDAFIVYKPHPDVMSGNRVGRLAQSQALAYADHVEAGLSVVSCIEACDEVHTMTSLAGFDALLRGKRVVTYGQPFYAGWGLTQDTLQDSAAFARRVRRLTLDELVAGALLRYPIYWDWELKGYTTCEAVLHRLVETRTALEANGGLAKLRVGYWRRQLRKLDVLVRAWLSKALTR